MKKIDYDDNYHTMHTELGILIEGHKHKTLLLKVVIEIYTKGFRVYVKPFWRTLSHVYVFKAAEQDTIIWEWEKK